MQGQIVRIISNLYGVMVNKEIINCRASGLFRHQNMVPMVGDKVIIDYEKKYITKIIPRKNSLIRPVIANVDEALVITSLKEPDLSLNLLDKEIASIVINKIEPVIIWTKLDLGSKEDLNYLDNLSKYYEGIGVKVFNNTQINDLKSYLQNKLVVVTGQTGSGKSSLINKLGNLAIESKAISKALGRGVHTTRHVEIYDFDGIRIADTPGFSALDLKNYTKEELKSAFREFSNYKCRFKDCLHYKEMDCGVKEAVLNSDILQSRYDNYLKFLEEVKK